MNRKQSLLGVAASALGGAIGAFGKFGLAEESRVNLREALGRAVSRRFEYRAAHAMRPTPPRQRRNLRYIDMPNGETVALTRGERKRVQRKRMAFALAAGQVSLSTPPEHANRRSRR